MGEFDPEPYLSHMAAGMAVVEMAVVGAGGTMATEAKAVMVAAGMAVVEMAVAGAGGTMATEPKAVMAAAAP